MTTSSPFAALRREIAELVDTAQKADREGNRPLARSSYERAIRMLHRGEGEYAPMLIRHIAQSYIDDGIFDAALDCLAAAQHLSRARGDTSGVAHAVNQMATANFQRGDLESAEALYHKAQALAASANDATLEASIAQSLGVVASMRGKLGARPIHEGRRAPGVGPPDGANAYTTPPRTTNSKPSANS